MYSVYGQLSIMIHTMAEFPDNIIYIFECSLIPSFIYCVAYFDMFTQKWETFSFIILERLKLLGLFFKFMFMFSIRNLKHTYTWTHMRTKTNGTFGEHTVELTAETVI